MHYKPADYINVACRTDGDGSIFPEYGCGKPMVSVLNQPDRIAPEARDTNVDFDRDLPSMHDEPCDPAGMILSCFRRSTRRIEQLSSVDRFSDVRPGDRMTHFIPYNDRVWVSMPTEFLDAELYVHYSTLRL